MMMSVYQQTAIKWPDLIDDCEYNNDSDDDEDAYIALN
jgi:hypothetical protein